MVVTILRSGVFALVVLFVTAALGAVPASAYWRASGTGNTTAAVATLLPPTNVSVPANSNSSVAVSWTGSSGTVAPTGYYVTRITGSTTMPACGSSPAALIPATTCTDTSVPEGIHKYQVTAVYRSWSAAGTVSGNVTVTSMRDLSFSSQPPTSVTAGSPITTFSVQLRTAFGLPVWESGVPITISIGANPGGGTLSGSLTANTNWSGTATFSGLSINKAGSGYSLMASSPGFAGVASSGFTVTPAAASKLVVTTGSTISGTASSAALLGPVTVERQDAYGNAVSVGTTAVTLSTTSTSTGTLAATVNGAKVTTVTIPAGSASAPFFYGDTKAGNATISLAASGLTSPAPVTATITAAAPAKLKFDAVPAVVLKNAPITPPVTVRILDTFGNQTDSAAQVTLQSACSTKGTLTRAAVSGVAAFPDLEIAGKASGCTLTATSGMLAADTSTPFNSD
ncbi:hypothetical protein [Pseudarthrobacter sp. NS4]|uniref:hypothetical protein n=1 Tax=Pseudarthrobacter sp. NS4 TaxID=2973976 RepID=UPI002163F91A|nr:hypothetical protein [Pseudarthrobacter sp. NS4]